MLRPSGVPGVDGGIVRRFPATVTPPGIDPGALETPDEP